LISLFLGLAEFYSEDISEEVYYIYYTTSGFRALGNLEYTYFCPWYWECSTQRVWNPLEEEERFIFDAARI